MTDLDVLRVFCGPYGRGGNELGVVRDGGAVSGERKRQALAGRLGFSETVFVDDPERGVVDIYTPRARLPFASRPLLGIAWLLDLPELLTPVGEVLTRQDGEFTWISVRPAWASGQHTHQYASSAQVDALSALPEGEGWLYAWAWQDASAGRVRARAFLRRGDAAVEDEATGVAALVLTHELGRSLNIAQGRGSQILTSPEPDGSVELGGRVALSEVRSLERPRG